MKKILIILVLCTGILFFTTACTDKEKKESSFPNKTSETTSSEPPIRDFKDLESDPDIIIEDEKSVEIDENDPNANVQEVD